MSDDTGCCGDRLLQVPVFEDQEAFHSDNAAVYSAETETKRDGSCLDNTQPPHSGLFPSTPCCQDASTSPAKPPTTSEDGSQKSEVAATGQVSTGERRKRRKPLHPQKSMSPWDPNFRGVTLCFHTVVQGGESELIITPFYSKNLARLQRRWRRLRHSSESELDGGHSTPDENAVSCDEQSPVLSTPPSTTTVKCCASCATRRTPLWRDAEDGTPLCNACGIRYRKYRLRCSTCWHIPRKDNKIFSACSRCGGVLRFAQARKF